MRYFNTFGTCVPDKHYMVVRERTLDQVVEQIDRGIYLILSRPRQYGKTTFISELDRHASDTYEIVWLGLDELNEDAFASVKEFTWAFCDSIMGLLKAGLNIPDETKMQMEQVIQRKTQMSMQELMGCIRSWCYSSPKPVVLVLDEVDCAQESDVFRDFLKKLRAAYLKRASKQLPTFQSVILAGVTDVEHLRSGIRSDGQSTGTGSPWNIADNIDFPLELPTEGIAQMLTEYELDHHTGMDIPAIAGTITRWTHGYPYLVSRICQIIDTKLVPDRYPTLRDAWTIGGVDEAAVSVIKEKNTLFSSLMEKVRDYPSLAQDLSDFLYRGQYIEYNPDSDAQNTMQLFGFVRVVDTHLEIANAIFQARLTKYFDNVYLEKHLQMVQNLRAVYGLGQYTTRDGSLDVYHILEDFVHAFTKTRNDIKLSENEAEAKFLEEDGRQMFLLYITPIINGCGTYTIEEQTSDRRCIDIVIHFRGRRYIIELKIWHGLQYNAEGERQLLGYMEYFEQSVGYMLTFNFNKNKQIGITAHPFGDKLIYEAIV